MEDFRFKGNVEKRLDIQLEMIETITEALRSAQKEIEDLKQRVCEDDLR